MSKESRNNLAPITVKLGNYSDWNRGRDFTRAVPLPVDRVLKSVVHGYVSYIYLVHSGSEVVCSYKI